MGTGAGGSEIPRRLIVRERAARDLNGIFRYSIEQWGVARAQAYRDLLFAAMRGLVERPKRGPADPLLPGRHSIKAGQHRIFYRFDETEVVILRVLHHAMDAPRHLP